MCYMILPYQIQRTDREDELNRKLTEYLQKLEDMTRQLGDINSRLQDCDNNKVRGEKDTPLVGGARRAYPFSLYRGIGR